MEQRKKKNCTAAGTSETVLVHVHTCMTPSSTVPPNAAAENYKQQSGGNTQKTKDCRMSLPTLPTKAVHNAPD